VKKNLLVAISLLMAVVLFSSFIIIVKSPLYSSVPPTDHTGAIGLYCTNCHAGTLNSGGGTVTVSGLPLGSYTAGAGYDFTLTTTHGLPDRTKWGFSIAARNSAGAQVGTFSSTNPNAALNGNEFSHNNAVSTANSSTYTYNNLKWTAPLTPGPDDASITFYYVANAASGGGAGGDFIYAGTINNVVLPVTLSYFNATILNKKSAELKWRTETEQSTSYFSIQKSDDGRLFTEIARKAAAGNSNTGINYSYIDLLRGVINSSADYRIEIVDIDGRKKVSPIKKLMFGNSVFVANAYPNHVKAGNQTQLVFDAAKPQTIILQIFSSDGKLLFKENIAANKGRNIHKIDVPTTWIKGLVIARFTSNEKTQQVKMMIE